MSEFTDLFETLTDPAMRRDRPDRAHFLSSVSRHDFTSRWG